MGQAMLGERRAVALLPLAFFGIMFTLSAILGDPAWTTVAAALGFTYLTAFFALAAGWFWGRWTAVGLGMSGAVSAFIGLIQAGWNPALAIFGGLHAAMALPLMGKAMAEQYELAPAAKAKLKMADKDIERLGKAVSRAAGSLPFLIIYVLGPRPEPERWMLGVLGLALAGTALFGLLRLRTYGVLAALGGAAAALLAAWQMPARVAALKPFSCTCGGTGTWGGLLGGATVGTSALVAALLLLLSAAPFLPAIARHLRGR